jgi:hypothetical protein
MPKPKQLRIASVTLSHIFGVPHEVEVMFSRKSGDQPTSAIIFGENGSGKSSIVKAVEWAVQDRVQRKALNRNTPRAGLLNVSTPGDNGFAAVTLSDGTVLLREAVWDQDDSQFTFNGTELPEPFQRSPIALTRADILTFIGSSPGARGAIFLDYELGAVSEPPSDSPELTYAEEEVTRFKQEIRAAAVPIAEYLGSPPCPRTTPAMIA